MTDSQQALDALNRLLGYFTDDSRVAAENLAQLNVAIDILTNGYQTDQARIDEDAAKVRADVEAQIIQLEADKSEAIAALDVEVVAHQKTTTELEAAKIERDSAKKELDDLQTSLIPTEIPPIV